VVLNKYKLNLPHAVRNLIQKLHPDIKRKIRAALEMILENPTIGKALKEELEGLWSFRVGKFRIIYRVSGNKTLDIIAIGPRMNIYRETFYLVKKEN